MSTNTVVRARIKEEVKDKASEILAGMGLSVSDAVRIMLTKVANEGALPFELTPNALTAETLRRSDRGEDLHKVDNADQLFKELGI
jgi:DNA-damage-inducible protein J